MGAARGARKREGKNHGFYDPQGISERQDVGGAIASQIGPLAEQVKGKVSDVANRASDALSEARDRGSEAAGKCR